MRDEGKEALTIWLSHDTKLRLEDLASVWRVTPSELIEQALAQFQPGTPPRIGNDTATLQLDAAIETVLARVLPGQVRALLDTMPPAPDTTPLVTATNGNVAATEHPETPAPTPSTHEYVAEHGHGLVMEQGRTRKGGRPRSPVGQQILDLLAAHPEGLSADELRVYLKATKPIGDILSGMKKTGAVTTQGEGKPLRYVAMS
jgi:predicted transcriptional regulator